MAGYWTRQRLFPTIVTCFVVALITVFLFVFPSIETQANYYNSQSIYNNSNIDFIAPEPSFEQVESLPGTYGIDKIFPFYLTKTQLSVNGASRTTTVLMSDQFQNIDITMYNDARLIKMAGAKIENPIFVDWQFCKDTGSDIGDTVTFSFGEKIVEYVIYAIYETNTVYDGGAVLVQISNTEKETISKTSQNNGYSGMYISASNYSNCQSYLTTEYRPLGRLKDRSQFSNDEQYKTHYNAIMSSGYANEISDFRARESNRGTTTDIMLLCAGAVLAAAILIVFNITMAKRGCEKVYFKKYLVIKGHDIRPYYKISFAIELILSLLLSVGALLLRVRFSDIYIPIDSFSIALAIVPVAIILAELICLMLNNANVKMYMSVSEAEKRKREAE